MNKKRIGILGTAEIAFRKFLPALKKIDTFEYVGVASRSYSNTIKFINDYGGKGYNGYQSMIDDSSLDAIYIPLPPALHYKWAKKALLSGKHVLMEKPFTTREKDTKELINIARNNNLAIHENYMFLYHNQLQRIEKMMEDSVIGDLRNIRLSFGFPKRAPNDFRYNKELGGGALLDCGGYPLRLATYLLGDDAYIATSNLNFTAEFNVDLYGSATLKNKKGKTVQIAFGMDNFYKCELEIWGSHGVIYTDRIFTPPIDYKPKIAISNNLETYTEVLDVDNTFYNSLEHFNKCIENKKLRNLNMNDIIRQSEFIDKIYKGGNYGD